MSFRFSASRTTHKEASWQPSLPSCSCNADGRDELAVWFPSLLAEAARSECAPSMRAVEGNQTSLMRWMIKSTQLKRDRAAALKKGILPKI